MSCVRNNLEEEEKEGEEEKEEEEEEDDDDDYDDDDDDDEEEEEQAEWYLQRQALNGIIALFLGFRIQGAPSWNFKRYSGPEWY